jgi:hypothetical protein
MTLSELGTLFGISRERVRQVEKRGINQVCNKLARNSTYKSGVYLNVSDLGFTADGMPIPDNLIRLLNQHIASQAIRIRLGALIYCALSKERIEFKKSYTR